MEFCQNCGHHYTVDSRGSEQAGSQEYPQGESAVCENCGSPRPYHDQPSPTPWEPGAGAGTLMNMVDSDTQKDQGGNPLAEGTIMGGDGEVGVDTGSRGRDNFMHGSVEGAEILAALWPTRDESTHSMMPCPKCKTPMQFEHVPGLMHCRGCGGSFPIQGDSEPSHVFEQNMMPYPSNADFKYMDHNDPPEFLVPPQDFGPPHQGSILAALVRVGGFWEDLPGGGQQYRQDDPMDKMNCPSCHQQVMVDRGQSEAAFCPNCNHEWPIYRDEPYVPQYVLPGAGKNPDPAGMVRFPIPLVPTELEHMNLGPIHQGSANAHANGPKPDVTSRMGFESRVNNMDPYEALWVKEAGPLALLAPAAEMAAPLLGDSAIGGAVGRGIGFAAGKGLFDAAGGLMHKALGIGGGGQKPQGEGYASPLSPQAEEQRFTHLDPITALFWFDSDYETPTSNPDVGTHENDPEKVDQKEFNDQDRKPENPLNPNNEDSGASGEDEVRDQAGFGPNSEGIKKLEELLPLVLHWYHSPESGADDPAMKELHELLENEVPGYLDQGDPDAADQFVHSLGEHPGGVHAKTATVPAIQGINNQVAPVTQMPGQPVAPAAGAPPSPVAPAGSATGQQNSACPGCGGVRTGGGACPQCGFQGAPLSGTSTHPPNGNWESAGGGAMGGGMSEWPQYAHTDILASFMEGATHVGPVTPEQVASVQNYLIENGRVDEVPNVPLDPGNPEYVQILNEIQNNPNTPPQVSPTEQAAPPPPPMAPGAPGGGMPVPGMAPGETGGAPMQPMAAVTASDNVAPRCPKCKSGTTGMLGDADGHAKCHSCNNIWKAPTVVDDGSGGTTSISHVAAGDNPNPIGVPAAEQQAPLNQGGDEDSSGGWQDTSGQPLKAGQEYSMHNPAITLPETIRVTNVKPDGIQVELLGTFKEPGFLAHTTHISREEVEMRKLTFEPLNENIDQRNNEPPPGQAAPGDAQIPPSGPTTDEYSNSYPLEGTTSSIRPDVCPHCGQDSKLSYMTSPSTEEHNCNRCGHVWQEKLEDAGGIAATASWIMEDDSPEDERMMREAEMMRAAGNKSRDIRDIASNDPRLKEIHERLEANKHTAGRHFTPLEQRTLIDEDGVARNQDLLNLAGTHYKSSKEMEKANSENAPFEHFDLGLW